MGIVPGAHNISLDPFPYAGTTTTCEALWMGVPCITLKGQCHAHNVGVSLLTTLGLEDWIAEDKEGYIRLAQVCVCVISPFGHVAVGAPW